MGGTIMHCAAALSAEPLVSELIQAQPTQSLRSQPTAGLRTSSQAFLFMRTYVWLSFLSPTITTAKPGT